MQFDVGGGPVVLKYSQRVDDGQYHQIQIIRNKEKGTIIVDDNDEEVVQGKCFLDLIQRTVLDSRIWTTKRELDLDGFTSNKFLPKIKRFSPPSYLSNETIQI